MSEQQKGNQAGASVVLKDAEVSTAAAARMRLASEEHFERWWASHGIHKRDHEPVVIDSYRNVARAAWLSGAGFIPSAPADERIERLEDRAQYLRMKIFNYRPQPMHRAKAELSALEWAIPIVMRATASVSVSPQENAKAK